jgi:hypothetical protein
MELWRGKMKLVPMAGPPIVFPDLSPNEIYPERAPAQNLVDAVLDPHRNQSPGRLGAAAMEVIEAACLSARLNQNVAVGSLALAR